MPARGLFRPGVACDATTTPGALNLQRPRQRKAAVTGAAAQAASDPVLMSCVRFRADPARSDCFRKPTAGSAQTGIEPMQLITSTQRQKLLDNGRAQRTALDQKQRAIDFEPVVKLFTPEGNATWLLAEWTQTRLSPSDFATSASGSRSSGS